MFYLPRCGPPARARFYSPETETSEVFFEVPGLFSRSSGPPSRSLIVHVPYASLVGELHLLVPVVFVSSLDDSRGTSFFCVFVTLLLYQYTLDLCEVLHIKGKILGEGSGRPSQKNSVKATLCAFSPSSTNLVPYLTCQHPPGQIFVMLLGLRSVPELRWSLTLHVSTHWDKS